MDQAKIRRDTLKVFVIVLLANVTARATYGAWSSYTAAVVVSIGVAFGAWVGWQWRIMGRSGPSR